MPIKKNKINLFLSNYLETKLLLYSVIILEFNSGNWNPPKKFTRSINYGS